MDEPTEITLTEVYHKYLGSNRALVLQNIPEDVGVDVLQNYLEVVLHNPLVHVSYTCSSRAAVVAVFKEDLKDLNSYRGYLEKHQLSGRHIALARLGGVGGVVVPSIASRDVSEDTLLYYFNSKESSGGHDGCVSHVEIHQTGDQRHGVVHIGNDKVIKAILKRDHVLNGNFVEVQPYFPSLQDYTFRRRSQTRPHYKPCQEVLPCPRYPPKPLSMSPSARNKNDGQEIIISSNQSQKNRNQLPGNTTSSKQSQGQRPTHQFPYHYHASYQRQRNPSALFMGPNVMTQDVTGTPHEPVVAALRDIVDILPEMIAVQNQSNRPKRGQHIDDKVADRGRTFPFKDEIQLDEVKFSLLRNASFCKQNKSENVNIYLYDKDAFKVRIECTTKEHLRDIKIKLFQMLRNIVEKDEEISECKWKLLSRRRNKDLVDKLFNERKSIACVNVDTNKQVLCCAAFAMAEINRALKLIEEVMFVEKIDVHHDKRCMIKSEDFQRLLRKFDVGKCAILFSESSSKIYIEGFERDAVRQARDKVVEHLTKPPSKHAAPTYSTHKHSAPRQNIGMKLTGAQAKRFESYLQLQGELQQQTRSMRMEVKKNESRDKVNAIEDEVTMQLARDTMGSIWHESVDFKKISNEGDTIMHQGPLAQSEYIPPGKRALQTKAFARSNSRHDTRQWTEQFQGDLPADIAEEVAIMMSLDESGATADPILSTRADSNTEVDVSTLVKESMSSSVSPNPNTISTSGGYSTFPESKKDSCVTKETDIILGKGEIAQQRAPADASTDTKHTLHFTLTDEILGQGATSAVFKGSYGNMDVAVKKILYNEPKLDEEVKRTEREKDILSQLEHWRHQNIIGFYTSQLCKPYLYIVLELCSGTLEDYVKPENEHWRASMAPSQVNRNMAEGLRFLHSKHIVHRDLKPSNILFRLEGNVVSKICLGDFGVAKQTDNSTFSVSGLFGTRGFWAPEVYDVVSGLENNERCDARSDTFVTGILFYYSYIGTHPFGTPLECQVNIIKGDKSLVELYDKDYACGSIVEAMLDREPNNRPTIDTVCEHPALWQDEEVVTFFNKVSDKLESEDDTVRDKIQHSHLIPENNWLRQLPPHMQSYLGSWKLNPRAKTPFYMGRLSSAYYLLRAIRNTNHHFQTYPADAKKELGTYPTGHVTVWKQCCPKLLLRLHDSLPALNMVWDRDKKEINQI